MDPEPNSTQNDLRLLRKKKKLEKKLKNKEKNKQIKRDRLSRDINYGAQTLKNYEKNWKDTLIKVKLPQMRQELEYAWHNFERVIDCKDFEISLLMDEIRVAEEQHIFNFRVHSENMENLMRLYQKQLDELREDFENDVDDFRNRHNNEIDDSNETKNENFNYLKTMLHQLQVAKITHKRIKKAEYRGKLDEAEVKHGDLFQKLKANLERKYQNIFDSMRVFICNYLKSIRKKKKTIKNLKEVDDAIQENITQHFDKIKSLNNSLRVLRDKFFDEKHRRDANIEYLNSQRQFFCNSYLALKKKLTNEHKDDFLKLSKLSESSANFMQFIEKIIEKGEKILKMAVMCRKLETKREKVLPFLSQSKCLSKIERRNAEEDENEDENIRKELQLFWQRVGEVNAVFYCLTREKRYLTDENQLFIEVHNNYCENLEYPQKKNFRKSVSVMKIDADLHMQKYHKFQGLFKRKM